MRKAKCDLCNNIVDSNEELPFFEFLGEGSKYAVNECECGYHRNAHDPEFAKKNAIKKTIVELGKCSGFKSRGPREFDRYYCGCRGWD